MSRVSYAVTSVAIDDEKDTSFQFEKFLLENLANPAKPVTSYLWIAWKHILKSGH